MREFKDAVTGNEEPAKQPEQLNATPPPAPTPTTPTPAETTAQPNSERVSS
jgi:hypothetical protein